MPNSVLLSANRKAIGGKEMVRAIGGIIGRFGNKYDLGRLRGSYLEVDIGDMRSENRLLGIIGRDVALQLHFPNTKGPIHYLVDSQNVNRSFKNGKWDFKSKSNDLGKYGHAIDASGFLRTDR